MDASQAGDSGVEYLAGTDTGSYPVDIDERALLRRPKPEGAEALRRNGEPAASHPLLNCTVAREMVAFIDLRVPSVTFTTRRTTSVTTFRRRTEG